MTAPATITPADTPAIIIDIRRPLFLRLDAKGAELPADAKKGHAITHFPQFGLYFDVRRWKNADNLQQAEAQAKKCDLLGRKGEWAIPEETEIQLLIDRSRHGPAVNPLIAPNAPSSGWVYTARGASWSPGRVWFVLLRRGGVLWRYDGYRGLVVPCLRVPPRQ
ncbi:hypothetical protein C3942_00665 [Solimonas fluminis]|uniref:DUF1566 domain-containing protein n=1 Tax=Solimonas fluminis TaxID=2086571 RepID=A0A2S5TKB4_9GAMM|nr:DUF1566 domain-containing protein [Solimonas fluminis]PPE75440.1 hypothetical protein C3942_00665 [Solimonas fluminis]